METAPGVSAISPRYLAGTAFAGPSGIVAYPLTWPVTLWISKNVPCVRRDGTMKW
jgi:hypothetical protein